MSDSGVRVSNREIYDSVQELKLMVATIQTEVAYLKEGRVSRAKTRLTMWATIGGWALGLPVSVVGLVT